MARQTTGHLFKRGGTYYLEYAANGQRFRQSLQTSNLREAKAARDRLLAPLAAKGAVERAKQVAAALADAQQTAVALADAARPKLLVADAWMAFTVATNRPQCGPLTLADYAQRWAKFADWWHANHATNRPHLEDVTRADARAFAAQIEGLSANRYNKIVQTARLVFTTLADQCGDMDNPFGATAKAGIRNQPQVTVGHRELSEGELRIVCGTATGELRTLLAIGLYTGLRLGDACTLRWEAVNLSLSRLAVNPHKTRTRGGKELGIPLHAVLAAILTETSPTARRDYILPETAALYQRDRSAVVKALRRIFHAAGIETSQDAGTVKKRSLVGFHSLRHSFVSICAEKGVPLAVVQELCGHGSPAIQRAYLHMSEGARRAAVDTLPDVLTATPAVPLALPVSDYPDDNTLRQEIVRLISSAPTARLQAALAVLRQ